MLLNQTHCHHTEHDLKGLASDCVTTVELSGVRSEIGAEVSGDCCMYEHSVSIVETSDWLWMIHGEEVTIVIFYQKQSFRAQFVVNCCCVQY